MVTIVPSGPTCVCARLESWWVWSLDTAAAASLSSISRSASSSRPGGNRPAAENRARADADCSAPASPALAARRQAVPGRWRRPALPNGVLPGRLGICASRRSSPALRSPLQPIGMAGKQAGLRNTPLRASAAASALASPSCCISGISPSSFSAAPRSPSGSVPGAPCSALNNPSSEACRFCCAPSCSPTCS